MTTQEMIAVLQAHSEGKQIQYKKIESFHWNETVLPPIWNFCNYDYRIKPEPPEPREWWLHINPETVHVREVLP